MQEDAKNTTHPQLAALFGILLVVVVPLITAIVFTITQIISHISVKEATESNIDQGALRAISEQTNLGTNTTVMHKIATDEDWLAVAASSTSPNDLGNGMLVILHEQNGTYQVVYIGSEYSEKRLTNLGVPVNLSKKLTTSNTISEYGEVIRNSYLNPDFKYPLLQNLPYQTDRLTIIYYFEDNLKDSEGTSIPIVRITAANAAERSNALDKIRRLGYDPGDYYIEFANLRNPFVNEVVEEIIEINVSEENQGP